MQTENILDCDDLGDALREGRPLRPARSYRILFALGNLEFQPLSVPDPVPLGRQILEAAGIKPDDGYCLFGIMSTGDFENVRLNEAFDLRQKGAERFIAFQTDRTFKLMLDNAQIEWGESAMKGSILYALAKLTDDEAVFLEVRGGEDRLIDPKELIDLTKPDIERFITAPKAAASFEIIVNSRSKSVLERNVTYKQIVQLAFPGEHASNVIFSMTFSACCLQAPLWRAW